MVGQTGGCPRRLAVGSRGATRARRAAVATTSVTGRRSGACVARRVRGWRRHRRRGHAQESRKDAIDATMPVIAPPVNSDPRSGQDDHHREPRLVAENAGPVARADRVLEEHGHSGPEPADLAVGRRRLHNSPDHHDPLAGGRGMGRGVPARRRADEAYRSCPGHGSQAERRRGRREVAIHEAGGVVDEARAPVRRRLDPDEGNPGVLGRLTRPPSFRVAVRWASAISESIGFTPLALGIALDIARISRSSCRRRAGLPRASTSAARVGSGDITGGSLSRAGVPPSHVPNDRAPGACSTWRPHRAADLVCSRHMSAPRLDPAPASASGSARAASPDPRTPSEPGTAPEGGDGDCVRTRRFTVPRSLWMGPGRFAPPLDGSLRARPARRTVCAWLRDCGVSSPSWGSTQSRRGAAMAHPDAAGPGAGRTRCGRPPGRRGAGPARRDDELTEMGLGGALRVGCSNEGANAAGRRVRRALPAVGRSPAAVGRVGQGLRHVAGQGAPDGPSWEEFELSWPPSAG